jgi:hypothetical protein
LEIELKYGYLVGDRLSEDTGENLGVMGETAWEARLGDNVGPLLEYGTSTTMGDSFGTILGDDGTTP